MFSHNLSTADAPSSSSQRRTALGRRLIISARPTLALAAEIEFLDPGVDVFAFTFG
jgi:hypothetical protein